MNWDHLRYFHAVARHGTMVAAATEFGVSEATVSRNIKSFQKAVQTHLLDADPSGCTLTPTGLALLPFIEKMVLAAAEVKSILQEEVGLTGTVRLFAPEIISGLLTSKIIIPLSELHPELMVQCFTASPLARFSETDIALLWNKTAPSNYACLGAYSVPFALYGTPEYLKKHSKNKKKIKLEDHWLVDFEDSGEHLAPSGWLKKSAKMKRSYRSNSPHARLTAATDNAGLAMLPCCFVKSESRLVKIIGEEEIGSLDVYLYLNKQREHLPHVIELSQQLKSKLRHLVGNNKTT
ncbi:LysR family transcriptional regulator [Spartinivicinus ruber]|uniref:LysR family transcriptional regulator n=1 Tax=Spartinivicinus ruber TaxID=2683272 RepID=UPI0013D271A4|nr:LysR family transcriptional regulator [Spartinivicinus ruber]